MLAIVYIYAGFAKLNPDWMYKAMPLSIWLPSKFSVPLIGSLMHEKWMHYLFSWTGALYDLTIVFFLMWKRTRMLAFVAVILFHVLTRVLFPIGMFPYIMIAGTFIFFSSGLHEKCLDRLYKLVGLSSGIFKNGLAFAERQKNKLGLIILSAFMLAQLLIPMRCFLYPGNLFWTERGYRFSWRVMLMEKTAYANFKIVDGQTGKRFFVQNDDFLSSFQEKQMATQPDFILEYAKFLGDKFEDDGHKNVEVYVESYASLNGRENQVYISPDVNLRLLTYKELVSNHIRPLK